MSSLKYFAPGVAGAVTGGVVALLIASGSSGSTKTVTDVVSSSGGAAPASTSVPTALSKSGGMTINSIYRKASPGVVDITVTAQQSTGGFGLFGGSSTQQTMGEGAGVVYDNKGDIITDQHVVANATSVEVHFQNGVNAKAKVLGEDASTDVAVIHVNVGSSELHPIPFANSQQVQVGDPVVAIGSPFSLPETATSGIVSAVGRSITAPNNYTITGAIQTDAAINPGNSGGPLLDASAQVLGLNDQIQTNSGQSAGVGFATPGNTDVQVANEIISGKKVEHAYVGLCLNPDSTAGAQIATTASTNCPAPVVAGSPAAQAGLQPGDTITTINGQAITSTNDFIAVIASFKPGQTITMKVTSQNGNKRSVKITLGVRPATAPTGG